MSKTYANITGAELLRADSCSQKIYITDNIGNYKNLVDEKHFWGSDDYTEKLYYDYKDISNRGWVVPQDGWNDYSQEKSHHLNPTQTDKWIERNIFCSNNSTLTVIQGYAGCGKTIFINNLLKNYLKEADSANYCDIYVDYDNDASENGYLPSSIRNHVMMQMINQLSEDDGWEIYKKFIELMRKYSEVSASFSNWLVLFKKEGQISKLAKKIYKNRNTNDLIQPLKTEFIIQFLSGTMAISGAFKGKLYEKINIKDLKNIDEFYVNPLLEFYLQIDFIFMYAINLIKKSNSVIVFYDNLDIIDNPQHIAHFICKLQEIMHKITIQFNKYSLRNVFHVIVAVRKITYALISSFSEVHDVERGIDSVQANFLDISNLYSSTQLLKHKANVILNNFQDYIPDEYNRTDVQIFLNDLIRIPDETLKEINLPELFNHNIRACANILERSMRYSSFIIPNKIDIKKMPSKCNSAIWINNICAVLQDNKIWSNLGYNTNNKTNVQFPTTLSRLILTYLYNRRREFIDREGNLNSTEVSFKEIVETFEKLPFSFCHGNIKNNCQEAERNYSKDDTRNKIIDILSKLLKRNMESDGINPKNEMELWRRPIYFTKNAFSLTDKNGNDNIKNELTKQMKIFNEPNADITDFCITDEGYVFIEKIATNFEFYSVRYNGNLAVPICYIDDADKINNLVENVYLQVKQCIENHQWLMGFYIKRYGKSKNNPFSEYYRQDVENYFFQRFHPRTEKSKPQLHIVRTIYDHIDYLNEYRDFLIDTNHSKLDELNLCLVRWIGYYLELYRDNLYELLENTVGSFNDVFLELKYLYWRIYDETDHLPYEDNNKNKRISIRRNESIRKNSTKYISDEILKNEPMLLE